MERRRPGRPHLGTRKRLPVRLPEDLAELAQAEAARQGLTFNDFVSGLIVSAIENSHRNDQEARQLNLTP